MNTQKNVNAIFLLLNFKFKKSHLELKKVNLISNIPLETIKRESLGGKVNIKNNTKKQQQRIKFTWFQN